ncbi:MAG: hypothetical protein AAF564_18975 [Bacteroidota bacterium]
MLLFSLALLLLLAITTPVQAQESANEAYNALQAGDYANAIERYKERLAIDENVASMDVIHYAEAFQITGAYEAGLDALEAFPDNAYVLHARGALYELMGAYQEAEAAYRAAAEQKQDLWRNLYLAAELFTRTGRESQAEELFNYIYRNYKNNAFRTAEELGVAAKAAARMGEFRDANDAFRTAHQLEPGHIRNLYWWGELFREKYNDADAQRTFDEAIAANPSYAPVYVGYARSVRSFAKQEEFARLALEKNPNSAPARNILAGLSILDGQLDQAENFVDEALAINPSSMEALAHLATIHHLRGAQPAFDEVEARALALNPRASDFYTLLAANCELKFRYPDAVAFGEKAIRTNRRDPNAYAQLGTSLLRLGRSQEARRYLDFSFEQDPFNLFVGNTLTLIDEYDDFALLESSHFRLLIHNTERDVLGPAILAEAEAAYASLVPRYPYTFREKIFIEAYNDADDFAVRVAGVPHLGLLGVSFGDVVAINTPRGQQPGSYNWARTLWHELVHTFSIGVSEFKLPRWFAEGLAVYEEHVARPEWGREMQLEFLMAFNEDKLLALNQMDRGFTRPTYQGQILMSYYHASRVIGFIADEYGFPAIVQVLQGFAAGKNDAASVRDATGQSLEAIDTAFRAQVQAEYTALAPVLRGMPNPFEDGEPGVLDGALVGRSDFLRALQTGYEALGAEQWDAAIAAFEEARILYPAYTDPGNPYSGLIAAYRAKEDNAKLTEVLEQFLAISEHGADEAKELGMLFLAQGEPDKATNYLERSLQVAPYDRDVYTSLASLYADAGDLNKAVRSRQAILGLNPVDRAAAYYEFARALQQATRSDEARRAVLQSLELAPAYRDAQKLLLEIVDGAP